MAHNDKPANTLTQKKHLLSERINEKKAFSFTYEGKKRIGYPYFHGVLEKSDRKDAEALRVYLKTKGNSDSEFVSGVNGTNSSEKDPDGKNFRVFYLEDMSDLIELDESFVPHKLYKGTDKLFVKKFNAVKI